jgi:hypothetical protein
MRRAHWFLVAGILSATAVVAGNAGSHAAQKKLDVPEPEKLEKARKFLHKSYADDYAKAAESLADRRPLAVLLRQEARTARDSDALYYTMLDEAAALAAQAGDAALAFDIIAEIDQEFAVNAWALKAAVLVRAGKTVSEPEIHRKLTAAALTAIDTALAAANFAAADQLQAAAKVTAAKSADKEQLARLDRAAVVIEGLRAEYDIVKPHIARLQTNLKDVEAGTAVGKYLCVGLAQWDKGLPLLLAGNDAGLKSLAKRDLANPTKASEQLALGDAYWDLAEAAKDPARLSFQKRAAHWYGQAFPELVGLNKTKVEKRVQSAGLELPPPNVPVGLLKKFEGHTKQVQTADISRDARFIVSGGDDDDLRFWDAATGKEVKTFKGHTAQVWSVAFAPDGKTILSSGEDQSVRWWDLANVKELKNLAGHTSTVNRVIFSPEGKRAASVSDDHSARLWDLDKGKEIMQFTGHQKPVWGASFNKDGSKLVTGGEDNVAIVWDAKTGKELQRFNGHTDIVFTVAVSPDGKHVVSAGGDKDLRLWELDTGKEVRKLEGHTGNVFSVAFSPDGKRILSSGQDRVVRLWDVEAGKQLHAFEGHTDDVGSVVFSADGRYAVSASMDMTVRLWGLPK